MKNERTFGANATKTSGGMVGKLYNKKITVENPGPYEKRGGGHFRTRVKEQIGHLVNTVDKDVSHKGPGVFGEGCPRGFCYRGTGCT